jgi:hypothetical protein
MRDDERPRLSHRGRDARGIEVAAHREGREEDGREHRDERDGAARERFRLWRCGSLVRCKEPLPTRACFWPGAANIVRPALEATTGAMRCSGAGSDGSI